MSVSAEQRGSLSPFRIALDLGDCIAEVERHTYHQLPVTYRTDQFTQSMLLITLSGR